MAFSLDKFLSDMMGNTDNKKKTKAKVTKTTSDKKKKQVKVLRKKQNIEAKKKKAKGAPGVLSQNMDDGGRAKLKRSQAKDKMPKKRPASITAISIIKKDTNIKTDKKPKKKKVIVTKAQLKKSGLTLRDYMNMLQGKTRRDYKDVKKAAQKKRAKRSIT